MVTTSEYEYNNKTVYGIKSNTVRYTWVGYHLFVIISSLAGDTTILIACIKYKAFKLHRVITVVIQHMAICDLMVCVTDIFPRLVSIIADDWVFGQFLCNCRTFIGYYFNQTNILLINVMTTNKLLLLRYPLRFGTTTLKKANMLCLICWLAAFISPVTAFLVDKQDIYFSYITYQRIYGFSADIWYWLIPLLASLVIVPTFQVVGATVCLLIIAKKSAKRGHDSLKWQGIMTTVLTATVYCISVLPYTVYSVRQSIANVLDKSQSFFTSFARIAISCLALNTISNFYIYSLTVLSFREFVRSRIELTWEFFSTKLGYSQRSNSA